MAWASALTTQPDDVELMISLATALAAQERTTDAVRLLHRATVVAPDAPRAWVQLGVISLVRQDHGTAGEALLHALDLDPANDEARFHLAVLHVVVGAVDEARDELGDLAGPAGRFASEAASLLARLPSSPG